MQGNSGKKVLIESKARAEPGRTGGEAVNQIGRGKEPQSNLPKAVKQAVNALPISTFLVSNNSIQSLHRPLRLCGARISAAPWRADELARGMHLEPLRAHSFRALLQDCTNPFPDWNAAVRQGGISQYLSVHTTDMARKEKHAFKSY